jgi:protein SCO1/2
MRKYSSGYKIIIFLLFLFWFDFGILTGQAILDDQPEVENIYINEHTGDKIPFDLSFTDENGTSVKIGGYFNKDKPVILMLGYYTCPMLCNLVMNGLSDAVKKIDLYPGRDYHMVTVSIDPRETDLIARAKKDNYMKYIGREGFEAGWSFLIGDSSQSKILADAIGFGYFYDEENEQYAHPAAIYVLTKDGTISRYFYGIKYNPRDLKFALMEASEGKIGTTLDRIILYCFHYDPDAKGYVLFARNIMTLGGAITLALLASGLGLLWLRDRRKHSRMLPGKPENLGGIKKT